MEQAEDGFRDDPAAHRAEVRAVVEDGGLAQDVLPQRRAGIQAQVVLPQLGEVVRDVVFAEDHSQIRTRNAPAVMATLRNLAVSLHRLTGATNIAACRHISRHPNRVLPLLT